MKGKPEKDITALLARLSKEEYGYLTTTGRITGGPHEIEIWFGIMGEALYLLSGGGDKSDWVKNLLKNPAVTVRIAKHTFKGPARIVKDEEEELMARHLLAGKYEGWKEGRRLSKWARTALPVAIELT